MGPAAGPGGSWTTRTSPRRRRWLTADVGEAARTACVRRARRRRRGWRWRRRRSAAEAALPTRRVRRLLRRKKQKRWISTKTIEVGNGPERRTHRAQRSSQSPVQVDHAYGRSGTVTRTQRPSCALVNRRVSVSARIARSPRCGRCKSTPSGSKCSPCSTCRRTASTVPWCMRRPTQCLGRTTHQTCARHLRAASSARTARSQGCARRSWSRMGSTCSRRTRCHRTGPNGSSCAWW